jgi:transcriptional regulator with XRE-family HTH domain
MPRVRTLTPGASPTHFFGSEVRRAREAAGMPQAELGALVPCDKSVVSRIEAGLTQPDEPFARACDAAFVHLDGFFTRFWRDCQTWGVAFPPAFAEFAAYEAEALALRWFEHSLVPGLLQTEDYARAVLERHPNVTDDQVAERVVARLARQAVLDRDDPPRFHVLLDENVLHREIGSAKIMHDQLDHLAAMAKRPNVTVQVISRIGAHVGLSGAFGIAEMADRHSVIYLENAADGQTVEDPSIAAEVELRFDVLRVEAFRGTESVTMMEKAAAEWEP